MTEAPASTTRQETAGQIETSNDNLVPPGAVTHEHVLLDAESEILRLSEFLDIHYPAEVDLSNRQMPESPVEVAMRLLQGMQATTGIAMQTRCAEAFCNKAAGHRDSCGWIHF